MKNLISEIVINALGNPNFNSDSVFDALKDVKQNGSTIALLGILPELEKLAKKHYNDQPQTFKR